MITKKEIEQCFRTGVAQGSTHMIVVCDTFDYQDYVVFVTSDQDVRKVVPKYQLSAGNMQKVMEVYDLSKGMLEQVYCDERVMNL